MVLMLGGETRAVDTLQPLLEAISGRQFHVGPCGSGHAVKAANNALLAASMWATGEAVTALARNVRPAAGKRGSASL